MTNLHFSPSILPFNRAELSTSSARGIDWAEPSDDYTLKTTEDKFRESKGRDLSSGKLNAETEKLVDAVLTPGKAGAPKVQVKTFAVDGIQSKDIMFIARVPPEPNRPNIVLFVPSQTGNSFLPFDNREQMNKWLKEVGSDPEKREKFSAHFLEGGSPVRNARVKEVMKQFAVDDINAIVGPFANEQDSIFKRLDREANSPPPSINGLSRLQEENQTETGRTVYSGYRPDGEKVKFEFDAYGNFMGVGDKGNFYFVQNGINVNRPLRPMTQKEFDIAVERQISKNVGADDLRGLYDSLLEHLEHPFEGIAEALEVFGVNKSTADTVERYLDNPFSALLLDLNKNNQIGKVFGLDKDTMDGILKGVGDVAQGFVPVYGQARALGGLLAKAIRNEPLSNQDTRDLADMLALKPDSPARKNIPAQIPEMRSEPTRFQPENRVDENSVQSVPENEYSVEMGGPMRNLNIAGEQVYTYTDTYKQGNRLNIVAHGVERGVFDKLLNKPSKAVIGNKEYTAAEFVKYLKSKGVDPASSDFDSVRLLICYSADGGESSFAREFQQAVGKPVKAFEGKVAMTFSSTEMGQVRQEVVRQIKDGYPDLSDGEVNRIADQKMKKLHANKVQRVEKDDGTYIEITMFNEKGVSKVKMSKITYKPVIFNR